MCLNPQGGALVFYMGRYHHVDICLKLQSHLGFSWHFNGTLRYFTFTVLTFDFSYVVPVFASQKLLHLLRLVVTSEEVVVGVKIRSVERSDRRSRKLNQKNKPMTIF